VADDNTDKGAGNGADTEEKPKRGAAAAAKAKAGADFVRLRIAQLVWLVCVVAALILAAGALLIALDANTDNALVEFVLDAADRLDLGVFDRENGIKDFTGKNAETKEALLNWGLAALAWLIGGRILDRIIRP
jgi:uncharacterized membrane protein